MDGIAVFAMDDTTVLEPLCRYFLDKKEMDIGNAVAHDGVYAPRGTLLANIILFRLNAKRICLHGVLFCHSRHCCRRFLYACPL